MKEDPITSLILKTIHLLIEPDCIYLAKYFSQDCSRKAQGQSSYADKSLCADSVVGEAEPGNGNRECKE